MTDYHHLKERYMTILLIDDDEDDRKLFCEVTAEVDKANTCITIGNG
jgi:hypothetical protein